MMNKYYELACGCPEQICEDITVSVPVTVSARAESGDVKLTCGKRECVMGDAMPCDCESVSKFKIIQKMKLCIPVKFIAECDVGEACCEYDLNDCECGGGIAVGQ
jgi:hypothetical protein